MRGPYPNLANRAGVVAAALTLASAAVGCGGNSSSDRTPVLEV
jgi:hypothetical protein